MTELLSVSIRNQVSESSERGLNQSVFYPQYDQWGFLKEGLLCMFVQQTCITSLKRLLIPLPFHGL